MFGNIDIELLVSEYGEHYRGFILNVVDALDRNETGWQPVDRLQYIKELLSCIGGY